jgi:carboxymethylenebutenolidase
MCDIDGCGKQDDRPLPKVDTEQRRLFLKGVGTLPLATVLAYPMLARASASKLENVSITLADGTEVSAALARPAAEKAPTVLLIHEWWGLNDQIKSVAAELAEMGYMALAVDLYGGQVASDADGARALMQGVDAGQATATLTGWIEWLRSHDNSTGKVATMGWCFGGGWSLNASIATPVDATVIYYGNVNRTPEQLAAIEGPVLGHFGTLDANINAEMVAGFEQAMSEAGKAEALTIHWYEADHAFANPTGARYDAEDAASSWERTSAFLNSHLM